MFMRFRGSGVGHKPIQKKIQKFCDDRWPKENDKPLQVQLANDNKEETAAQPEASSLINPNADDIELELLKRKLNPIQRMPVVETTQTRKDGDAIPYITFQRATRSYKIWTFLLMSIGTLYHNRCPVTIIVINLLKPSRYGMVSLPSAIISEMAKRVVVQLQSAASNPIATISPAGPPEFVALTAITISSVD
ncbi:hypothetical protein JOM56_013691 [Amanita muscaria]